MEPETVCSMRNNKQDLLEALRVELGFLEKGGYRRPVRAAWRPQFIFQDSPTCLNFEGAQPPMPCSKCILMQVVPADSRARKFPCRHIPLNERGDALDSLYRSGTQEEIESALREWLQAEIAKLERERVESTRISEQSEIHVRAKFLTGD